MAAVISPQPNARYLNSANLFPLNFSWNRINMDDSDLLRLEISNDQRFNSINQIKDNLYSGAAAVLEKGTWYWRIKLEDKVLNNGRFTIVDAKKPHLLTPYNESEFLYRINKPEILFRWTGVDEADYYLLQIADTPYFDNTVELKVQGTYCNYSYLGTGNWYRRVLPVYSALYNGSAAYSDTANFKIRQSGIIEAPVLISPADEVIVTLGENRRDLYFSWAGGKEALSYTIQISKYPDMQNPVISNTVLSNYYIYPQSEELLSPGRYYWNVYYIVSDGSTSPSAKGRSIVAQEDAVKETLAGKERLPAVTQQTAPVSEIPDTAANLTLISPALSTIALPEVVPALTAVPAAAVIPPPAAPVARVQQQPETRVQRQPETPPPPQVRPVILLEAPWRLTPAKGHKIEVSDLRVNRYIEFSWQAVNEANAYIFTILTDNDVQVFRTGPLNNTNVKYTDLERLDYQKSYIWNVEAVYVNSEGIIERHGRPADSSFTLDIPAPAGRIQTAKTGVMYGH
jgi:hypothetical protein